MKRFLLVSTVVIFYGLHQDFWFWRTARPLVYGFIPIGLFYHACFSVAASLLMWLLVKLAWPSYLEDQIDRPDHFSVRNQETPQRQAEPGEVS
jgi:hypothetical protein